MAAHAATGGSSDSGIFCPVEALLHSLQPGPDDPETGRALHQTSRVSSLKEEHDGIGGSDR